jgi:iron complex transport system ATP-binding protein
MVERTSAAKHPPALAFESVSFGYGRRPVVRDVTLQITAGEMAGLLGPNGAGKSTLLRLGAGALRPQAGVVRLAGADIQRLPRREVARRLAVAPQEFVVQFAYTVRQIVELGRTPHHDLFGLGLSHREDAQAVTLALAAAGVEHLADRVFNDLSGGERQRVLIALTLAQEAPILLLDEPTAHLDIRYQIETLDLLRRMNAERKLTVVAALHDLNLAARYFPRLLLFRETIVADGPPAHVLDAALLSEVYETPVRVGILRGEQHLSVLPPGQDETVVWRPERPDEVVAPAVHLIAGGGSGELMMRALADAGVVFSAGPLNVGDSDYALARRLAAVCIAEAPYAPVSAETLADAQSRMLAAQAVVLCPTPLGPGNITLVEAALAARREGRMVALLEPSVNSQDDADGVLASVGARDFSGRGVELYRQLLANGCPITTTPATALRLLTR